MNETKWLTVKEASLLAHEMGLNRTTKTIRTWARQGHVKATKQTTQNGEMWVLDKQELATKINAELEFMAQAEQVLTLPNQRPNTSEPVQTRANPSEPVRTSTDQSEPVHLGSNHSERADIKALQSQIQVLKVDVAWRDKMLEKLERENEKGNDSLMAQARFIGHLETKLERLGEAPNQKYLDAPIPSSNENQGVEPEVIASENAQPHPDQQNLYTGRT